MYKVSVDGVELEVPEGATVMQACELAGTEIPRFCYHERLSIAGNCRMCLVEVEKSPKPVASCAMPVGDGMVIKTSTEKVKNAREGVMEFLLINHPLDCPICDQGGECDLQDQSLYYGRSYSRFKEDKRAVTNKSFGPLISTFMTRCIQCTRCVRFMDEVAGKHNLGAINRGEDMEISTYLKDSIDNELSGNIIDLCPVGALTSKPYAFTCRSWELTHTESIDVLDAVGSNIRIDHKDGVVMRVLPRLNEKINEEWLSDKGRFAYDGLLSQRLDQPYIRKDGILKPTSWKNALSTVGEKMTSINPKKIAAIAGDLIDIESMYSLKLILDNLGCFNRDCRQDGADIPTEESSCWFLNDRIDGIDKADSIILIGLDLKREAPLVNARIRRNWLERDISIFGLGVPDDLPYKMNNLGNDPKILQEIQSENSDINRQLKQSRYPLILLGMSVFTRSDSKVILNLIYHLIEEINGVKKDWNGFGVLQKAAARVGGLAVGFVPENKGYNAKEIFKNCNKGNIELLYSLGADEIDHNVMKKPFVVYQGHHGDKGAEYADVIFPGSAYTEKSGLYFNTEGRLQSTQAAVPPPGSAKEDWKVLRALSEQIGVPLPFNTHSELRLSIFSLWKDVNKVGDLINTSGKKIGKEGKILEHPFKDSKLKNYYMTCPISRSSKTMAECATLFSKTKMIK